MTTFQPSDAGQAEETIAWAAAEGQSLEVVAGGSKRALGRPTIISDDDTPRVKRMLGVGSR